MIASAVKDIATPDNLIPGGLFATLVGLVAYFIRQMAADRGAGFVLASERKDDLHQLRIEYVELQKQCAEERLEHARELADREERHAHEYASLQQDIFEQRKLKHDAVNKALTFELLVETVRRLAVGCTCGSLDAVQQVLNRQE